MFLFCKVTKQQTTKAVNVSIDPTMRRRDGKWRFDISHPRQSFDKSILVTLHCVLRLTLPTTNLPPPTPIRTESQAHYSGQLANGLGALRHYSRLIWFQSDDGAMSTQAACHSGELTQKDKGGGQV